MGQRGSIVFFERSPQLHEEGGPFSSKRLYLPRGPYAKFVVQHYQRDTTLLIFFCCSSLQSGQPPLTTPELNLIPIWVS